MVRVRHMQTKLRWLMPMTILASAFASAAANDKSTLLLCRFDGNTGGDGLNADVARGDGRTVSARGCRLVPGREGQGVQIGTRDQSGQLAYTAVGNLEVGRGTIEFWVRLNWDCTEETSRRQRVWFDVGTGEDRDRLLLHSRGDELTFTLRDSAGVAYGLRAKSFAQWRAGEWHHVACTWDVRHKSLTLWADHALEAARPSNAPQGDWQLDSREFKTIRLGSFGNIDTPFDGILDELRISNVVRYTPEPEQVSREQAADLRTQQTEGKKTLAELTHGIHLARQKGIDVSYFETVAEAGRTGVWRMEESPRRPSLREMLSYCDYLLTRCARAQAELTAVMAGQRRALNVPRPGVLDLRIVGDTFQDRQGEPVLLIGIRNLAPDEVAAMSGFFNLHAWSWQSPEQIANDQKHNVCGQVHLSWSLAVKEALKSQPDMANVGGYSGHNWAKGLCVESPTSRRVIAEAIAELPIIRRGEAPPCPYALLSSEDQYLCSCSRSMEMFRQWLRERYRDTDKLNEVWGIRYDGFGDVPPPRLEGGVLMPANRAAWSDWLRFNRDRVTAFYHWLKSQVRQAWPHTPLNAGTNLRPGHSRWAATGVDTEALNEQINDVMQCEAMYGLPTPRAGRDLPPYGMDLFGELDLDFQRSTCNKPATDLEFHAWMTVVLRLYERGETLPSNYTASAIYRHFLHGVRAANIWVWNRAKAGADNPDAFGCSPAIPLGSVEECFRAALDVRRLAREITALSHIPAPVAIFLSDSTFLNIPPTFIKLWHVPTPCTVELDNVYHGSLFLDTPIGFVTERTIARGQLNRYKVVLVPAVSHVPEHVFKALMDYVEGGGILLVTPRSFLFDEHHRPHAYWQGLLELRETVLYGNPPEPGRMALNDPTLAEKYVADPGDARHPGIPISPTGRGVLEKVTSKLEGVGAVQVIGVSAGDTLATFADGAPAIVSLRRGQGTIYYCACALRPRSYASVLEAVLGEAGVQRPIRVLDATDRTAWGVEGRACRYEGDILLYAMNLLTEPTTVRLSGPQPIQTVHDLLVDQALGERFILAPLQTVILRVKIGPADSGATDEHR